MTTTCDWCGAATHDGVYLCPKHVTTLAHAATNTGTHYADLETLRTGQRATRYDKTGGKGARAEGYIGMSLRFANPDPNGRGAITEGHGTRLIAATRNATVTWTRVALDTWPNLATPADNVPALCAFLASIATAIAGQPWAAEALKDLRTCERGLANLVDVAPPKWYAGRCSAPTNEDQTEHCQVDLYARSSSGFIDCPGCGIRHDVADRREVLLREAEDYLVTASEAAGALSAWTDYDRGVDKLADRIRQWSARNRLVQHGTAPVAGRERALYRLGDVLELLVNDVVQRAGKRSA
jgi:hypothetical protein